MGDGVGRDGHDEAYAEMRLDQTSRKAHHARLRTDEFGRTRPKPCLPWRPIDHRLSGRRGSVALSK